MFLQPHWKVAFRILEREKHLPYFIKSDFIESIQIRGLHN